MDSNYQVFITNTYLKQSFMHISHICPILARNMYFVQLRSSQSNKKCHTSCTISHIISFSIESNKCLSEHYVTSFQRYLYIADSVL